MRYDVIPKDTKRNFFHCIHNALAGVGTTEEQREIFKTLFRNNKIDYYICDKVKYLIIGEECDYILTSLVELKHNKNGYYFEDVTKTRIYLTSQNFSIICSASCSNPEAWVKEYIPPEPKKEDEPHFVLEELPYEKVDYD